MMNSRPSVCRRRTFIEGEARFTLALTDALFENFILFPELQNFALELRIFYFVADFLELAQFLIS